MNIVIALLLGAGLAYVAWRAIQESRSLAAARAGLLSSMLEGLGEPAEEQLPSGYRKVSGIYRGFPVVIEPVVDTLNVRKLPVLWLMTTVVTPVPVRATFDMLMRPSGNEVFSQFHRLDHVMERPDGFPEWATLRTDNPAGLPPASLIAPYLSRFECGNGKELLVTPKGLRMVVMLDQADRGGYLIFRDARFAEASVPAETVTGILDDLIALKADLEAVQLEDTRHDT